MSSAIPFSAGRRLASISACERAPRWAARPARRPSRWGCPRCRLPSADRRGSAVRAASRVVRAATTRRAARRRSGRGSEVASARVSSGREGPCAASSCARVARARSGCDPGLPAGQRPARPARAAAVAWSSPISSSACAARRKHARAGAPAAGERSPGRRGHRRARAAGSKLAATGRLGARRRGMYGQVRDEQVDRRRGRRLDRRPGRRAPKLDAIGDAVADGVLDGDGQRVARTRRWRSNRTSSRNPARRSVTASAMTIAPLPCRRPRPGTAARPRLAALELSTLAHAFRRQVHQQLRLRPRDQRPGVDREGEAVELLHARGCRRRARRCAPLECAPRRPRPARRRRVPRDAPARRCARCRARARAAARRPARGPTREPLAREAAPVAGAAERARPHGRARGRPLASQTPGTHDTEQVARSGAAPPRPSSRRCRRTSRSTTASPTRRFSSRTSGSHSGRVGETRRSS